MPVFTIEGFGTFEGEAGTRAVGWSAPGSESAGVVETDPHRHPMDELIKEEDSAR